MRDSGFVGGEFGGIHGIVAEVLGSSNDPSRSRCSLYRRDALRIEVHLHLHVLRGRTEGSGELFGEAVVGVFRCRRRSSGRCRCGPARSSRRVVQAVRADAGDVEGDAVLAERFHLFREASGLASPRLAAPSVKSTMRFWAPAS